MKRVIFLVLCFVLCPLSAHAQYTQPRGGLPRNPSFDSVTIGTTTLWSSTGSHTLLSNWLESNALQVYVSSTAGAGGDGSVDRPYNILSQIDLGTGGARSLYDARHTDGRATIVNLKYGSLFRELLYIAEGNMGSTTYPLVFRAYGDPAAGLPIITGGDVFATFAGPDGNGEYTKAGVIVEPLNVIAIAGDGTITMLTPGTVGSLTSTQFAWAANTLYLGFDPATYTIEASQREFAVRIDSAGYVEFENISCRNTLNDIWSLSHDAYGAGTGNLDASHIVLRNIEAHYDTSLSTSDGVTAHDNVQVEVYGYRCSYLQRAITTVDVVVATLEDFITDHNAYFTESNSGTSYFRRGTIDNNTTAVVRFTSTAAAPANIYFQGVKVTNTPQFATINSYSPAGPSFIDLRGVLYTGVGANIALYLNDSDADIRVYDSTFYQLAADNNSHLVYGVSGSKFTSKGSIYYCPATKYTIDLVTGATYTGDYNDFYQETSAVASLNSGTGAQTLAQWQTSTGQDAHSLNVDPGFDGNFAPSAASLLDVAGYTMIQSPIRDARQYIKPKVGTAADIGGVGSGY